MDKYSGCYEFYLKNKNTAETARIISNSLLNACFILGWNLSNVILEGTHETYGKVLEKNESPANMVKTSEDFELSKFCL